MNSYKVKPINSCRPVYFVDKQCITNKSQGNGCVTLLAALLCYSQTFSKNWLKRNIVEIHNLYGERTSGIKHKLLKYYVKCEKRNKIKACKV